MSTAPLYWTIAVADIEGFGKRTDTTQPRLRSELHAVLKAALHEEGIDWAALDKPTGTGDGAILLIPPTVPKTAVTRALTRRLHSELVRRTLSETPVPELRLRISLHAGEVAEDDYGPVGTDLNTACRLVDAQLLRDVLTAAVRSHVAVIASSAWYHAVVRHDHDGIDPAAYAPTRLVVKELDETVWVHVPGLSTPPGLPPYQPHGGAQPGTGPAAAAPVAPAPGSAGSRTLTINNSPINGDVVQGDKNQHDTYYARGAS